MKLSNVAAIILLLIGIGLFTNGVQEVFNHIKPRQCVFTGTPPDYVTCWTPTVEWKVVDSRKILYSFTVGLGCVLGAIVVSDTEK